MSKVYRTQDSDKSNAPDYVIQNGRFFRTINHPAGWSDIADYELGSDGKVYPLAKSGHSAGSTAVYEFRNIMLYRTAAHPDGVREQPDYYICD